MTTFEQQTLYVLFCLSRDNQRTDAGSLAAAVGATPTHAARALIALERAGLVDATRARLTMRGLATALRKGPAALGGTLLGRARDTQATLLKRIPVAAQPAALSN
jgi:hypothetical protein